MFATISSGFDLPLRGKCDQQQPPKPDVDAVFARLARCVFKVFLDTRLARAFTPIVTYSTHFGKLEGTSTNPSSVKVTKDYWSWCLNVPLHLIKVDETKSWIVFGTILLLVKINLSRNTAALLPPASTASARRFAGWPKRFLGRRCFSLQAHDILVKFQEIVGKKLHPAKSTKSGQNTQSSLVSLIFLFQKQGRNSVNGWLVSQVGSWVYLPKEAMMNKSMSLWGNAMCDVGGRGCIYVTYVAKCGMLTSNWFSPNFWTNNRNLPRMDATPSQTIIDPPKKMACRCFPFTTKAISGSMSAFGGAEKPLGVCG